MPLNQTHLELQPFTLEQEDLSPIQETLKPFHTNTKQVKFLALFLMKSSKMAYLGDAGHDQLPPLCQGRALLPSLHLLTPL